MAGRTPAIRWISSVLLVLSAGAFLSSLWLGSTDEQEPMMKAAEPEPDSSGRPQQLSEPVAHEGTRSSRADSIDRGIARGDLNANYRDELIAADSDEAWQELLNQFYVIPTTRREGDNTSCHPVETVDGKRRCWNHYGFHPYLGQSIDELQELGDTDPAAANALMLLLPGEERDLRMYYALQAGHLSQKPGPIYQFARMMSPGKWDHDARLEQYALLKLGDELGSPLHLSRILGRDLRRDLEMTDEEFREAVQAVIQDLFDRAKEARWQG